MPWLRCLICVTRSTLLFVVIIAANCHVLFAQTNSKDSILTFAVVYAGDTIEAKTLSKVFFYSRFSAAANAKWNRLRNAIYVTYPYAQRAGAIMNDIHSKLKNVTGKSERRKYIRSREKELKKEFTDPLTNLSVYQGKVLMKLINRETGNNCYDIIKEHKSGLTARFYQTVAFFYSSSLKQPYDADGDDAEIEFIVQDFCRKYGYRYNASHQTPMSME